MKRLARYFLVAAVAALIQTGCTLGPDFRPPPPPEASGYTSSPLPEETVSTAVPAGESQRFEFTRQLSAQWWKMFRSPELDTLIARGLANNPSLSAADAAIREARENLSAAGGALLYPNVDANLSATKQKSSGVGFGGGNLRYELFTASVRVSYTLDLFGANRRQLEGLGALVNYQQFQYEAAYLTLTSNLVATAIREAALTAQISTTEDIVRAEKKQLDLVRQRFELGAVSRSAVLNQEAELAKSRASLPPLEKELAVTRHALAALTGHLPSEGGKERFELESLHLPQVLPVSLPSSLVRQRPDIRASEALFHQAAAEVGVATANLYPQITLSGGVGFASDSLGDLFTQQSSIWNLGGQLLQPLFHGGELQAKRRAAVAAYQQAAARYRLTVLQAFQNVADVLRALDSDAQTLQAQAEVEKATKANFEMTRKQFKLGAVSYLPLLVAQRDYEQAQLGLIIARAQRFADTAALFQALGGGWWNRESEDRDESPGEVPQ